MLKELNEIEEQMKILNMENEGCTSKKSILKSSRRIRIKVPSDHQMSIDEDVQSRVNENNDDFYRFLQIQALTIEEAIQ